VLASGLRAGADHRKQGQQTGAGRRTVLSCRQSDPAGAGVEQLVRARRQAIQGVASQHEVEGIRWWPPTAAPRWVDFLIEGVPGSLPAFRADLERAVGCPVAIYLADQMPSETWQRIAPDTVLV
jgi:hypothetical protein